MNDLTVKETKVEPTTVTTTTTQLTSKDTKLGILLGSIIFWVGMLMFIVGEGGTLAFGFLLTLAGFGVYLGYKIKQWWNHD